MENSFAKITKSNIFKRATICLILFSAVIVGLETYPQLYIPNKAVFKTIDFIIQTLFTLEITLRLLSYGKKPYDFFKNGSNVFDFFITVLFFLPIGGAYVSAFRLLRLLRVLRLLTALPRLQVLVGALIKSVPSMGYISLLLIMQFYIFAVLGNFLFGTIDPVHFGDLGRAMLTLFQIITLEGWVDIMKNLKNTVAPIYFISFILLGTMIILNLFIGVILNGFEEVKEEIEQEADESKDDSKKELVKIKKQLRLIISRLEKIN